MAGNSADWSNGLKWSCTKPQSDLAQQITSDPYNFDFLLLGPEAHARDLERGLLDHLRKFLLELGVGFAFVGSQYRIQVREEEFFIDLLFYHLNRSIEA
jgi:predicted nuclease of restriction endonuclease-like (RecB) superfamily